MLQSVQKIELSPSLTKTFHTLSSSLAKFSSIKELSGWVRDLSNIYIKKEGSSHIWDNPRHVAAYLNYFLPLNIMRLKSVLKEAHRLNFFQDIKQIIDIGSGPNTTLLALSDTPPLNDNSSAIKSTYIIEASSSAQAVGKKILEELKIQLPHPIELNGINNYLNKNSLVVFSYSLNEMAEESLDIIEKSEALLFLEPSTQLEGRNLQKLRERLIDKGFYIWAPCTHQEGCPLLSDSKTDWCHTRVHISLPDSINEIERFLPMKNKSLTYSYLLARKTPPIDRKNGVRVIGDTLFEKGKVRQSICRKDKREFLSWLKRDADMGLFERGSYLNELPPHEEKGNELRIKKDSKLLSGSSQ